MKKTAYISAVIAVLLLPLLLTGWADAGSEANRALRQGNGLFATASYQDALASYEQGLAASPQDGILNFNAAQTAYILGEYEKAVQYYENADDSTDKYLNAGNIFFRAGDALEDANEKAQCYAQALQIYMAGIIAHPQNVPLKYNFEAAKAKLEEFAEEQEQQGEGEEGEEGEQGEGQSGEGQEGEEQQSEGSQGEEQQGEEQQASQGSEEEGEEQQGEAQSEGEEGEEQGYSEGEEGEGEGSTDAEAIARILEMLEGKEEESLKNNQAVVGGKDGGNGW